MISIQQEPEACLLTIKAVPGSSRTQIGGLLGDAVKINVAAAPEKGKANKELVKYLAKILDISKSSITIVAGEKDHRKVVRLANVKKEKLESVLTEFL